MHFPQKPVDHLTRHSGIWLIVTKIRFQIRHIEREVLVKFTPACGVAAGVHPRESPADAGDDALNARQQPLAFLDEARAIEPVHLD
jgi:hypothetical protein